MAISESLEGTGPGSGEGELDDRRPPQRPISLVSLGTKLELNAHELQQHEK